MRIGVDLGGTKIEALSLDNDGRELARYRVDTPRGDYAETIAAIKGLVLRLEAEAGVVGTVGIGIPGSISARTGLVKNANSTWLNGQPFQRHLSEAMDREVRIANDANCLAVSEATDGAAAGRQVVFGVILGTGCGGGVAFNGHVHSGPNGVAGEWGHIPLPWPQPSENPGPACYCGKYGCMETWVSGTGIAREFLAHTGRALTARQIVSDAEAGQVEALAALDRLEDRLARGLAVMVEVLDPDVIVFGGGVSRVEQIYKGVAAKLPAYIFGGEFETPLLPALHGDSSGVRGAAWLWPLL